MEKEKESKIAKILEKEKITEEEIFELKEVCTYINFIKYSADKVVKVPYYLGSITQTQMIIFLKEYFDNEKIIVKLGHTDEYIPIYSYKDFFFKYIEPLEVSVEDALNLFNLGYFERVWKIFELAKIVIEDANMRYISATSKEKFKIGLNSSNGSIIIE